MQTLGLAFIFRDDVVTIGNMLDSLVPHVDQVVAVDTGSSDGSRKIVEEKLGSMVNAVILDHDWPGRDDPTATLDDFTKPRNLGWKALTSDWAVWADADDVVEGADQFRRVIQPPGPGVDALVFPYDYAQTPSGACVCTLNRERLLRDPQLWHWISPVHEVLAPDFPAQYLMADFAIWRHRKQPRPSDGERNLLIIKQHIADCERDGIAPDARMLAYHGVELAARGQHEEAIEAYKAYMQVSQWGEEKHQVLHRMADSYRALQALDEAMQVETYAMTHAAQNGVPEWADHLNGIGETLLALGHPAHAIPWLERGLQLGMPNSSLILNPRDYDYAPNFQLAMAHLQLGQFEQAAEYINKAGAIIPEDPAVQQNARLIAQQLSGYRAAMATADYLETLIRFDENLKARQAIKTMPYVARQHPRVQQLIEHIRISTFQVGDRDGYERMYATNREVRNPDELVLDASARLSRVTTLANGLRQQAGLEPLDPAQFDEPSEFLEAMKSETPTGLRLLDAGCNDGWVGAHCESILNLVDRADGIDLNPEAIAAAVKRKQDFSLAGEFQVGFVEDAADQFDSGYYDAVALFEVFEHLEDPNASVAQLERALKPGGRMYISTPVGAYEAGILQNWQQNTAKQHLRAVPLAEFARFALLRGKLEAMSVGADGVQTVAYTPRESLGKVCIYCGHSPEQWAPEDIEGRGLGGSETAVVKVAEGLAARGYFVEVFAGTSIAGPVNGVLYRPPFEFDPDEHYDLFVAWRGPNVIDLAPTATTKALWLHDATCRGQLKDRIERFDEVWTLSGAHEKAIRESEGLADASYDDYFRPFRNGIDLKRYQNGARPFQHRSSAVVYSSSPDRGLETLLRLWPKIKDKAPRAELHVYYGFDVFDAMHANNPERQEWKRRLLQAAEELDDVIMQGRVSQIDLSEAQQHARVWAYPYAYDNPTETSCITAMEAMAAGMFVVTTASGALPETLGGVGACLKGSNEAFPDDQFVAEVVKGLKSPQQFAKQQKMALQRAQELSWDGVVEMVANLVRETALDTI